MTSTPGQSAPSASPKTEIRERSRLRTSLLIALVCFAIYNANGRAISAGDCYPARYLPLAVVQYHTVYLNPIANVVAQGRGDTAFWMLHLPDGRLMSLYPITVPVVVAPLYVPAVLYLHLRGWTEARVDFVARVMEKLTASFLAALSAGLMYLLLRRRAAMRTALLLTFAYALGTTTWVISSQALWQHGLAELLAIAALLLVTGPCTTPRAIALALACGVLAGNRPPDAILAAAIGLYALVWAGRRRALLLAVVAALPILLVLFYNMSSVHRLGGGYALAGTPQFFSHPLFEGLAGILVSPTRGLFVFSPFLLAILLVWRYLPRGRDERLLAAALGAAIVLQLVLYAKTDWRSGMSWGPRYMTDLLPFAIWLLVPVVESLRGVLRAGFLAAVAASVAIQAIGAFSYVGWHDSPIVATGEAPGQFDAAWNWRNSSIFSPLRYGLAPAELGIKMQGSFDAIEAGGRAVSELTAGQEAVAVGWTLARHDTPWQVAISVDGHESFVTNQFVDRADVRASLGETNLAGWRIPIDTSRLTPGEQHLSLLVWASPKGDVHYAGQRRLVVRASRGTPVAAAAPRPETDLAESARKAAAQIRGHQQSDGSWLTVYTSSTRFAGPHPEMNTFLTSVLVDLLDPLAATAGLGDSIGRARQHLTHQIEPGGLVRYHGRPDGPGIGTLGCVISPDTDDTALVWRVAPAADRTQLASALATIDHYRTSDGLYLSWLAPRDQFQCLDPGSDPNPPDIGLQLHLLMLLAQVRPASAPPLCSALRGAIDQDRIWVYYRKTPLVPMLRLPDLERAGCGLQLPESRMRTDVPGQAIWLTVARLLAPAPGASPRDSVLVRAVLRELARDDFALVRTEPPLLYHNDLTATVPRYFWSKDVGYALWLRLYEDHEP